MSLIFYYLLHAFTRQTAECTASISAACIPFHHLIKCCSNYNITTQKKARPIYSELRPVEREARLQSGFYTLKFNSKQSTDSDTPRLLGHLQLTLTNRDWCFCCAACHMNENVKAAGGRRTKEDKTQTFGSEVRGWLMMMTGSAVSIFLPADTSQAHISTHTPSSPLQHLAPELFCVSL